MSNYSWAECLTPLSPLNNFEIQKHQNRSKFKGVYAKTSLPVVAVVERTAPTVAAQIKDGAYVMYFDEYKSIETHWIVLFVNGDDVAYFDNFKVEYNLEEI